MVCQVLSSLRYQYWLIRKALFPTELWAHSSETVTHCMRCVHMYILTHMTNCQKGSSRMLSQTRIPKLMPTYHGFPSPFQPVDTFGIWKTLGEHQERYSRLYTGTPGIYHHILDSILPPFANSTEANIASWVGRQTSALQTVIIILFAAWRSFPVFFLMLWNCRWIIQHA